MFQKLTVALRLGAGVVVAVWIAAAIAAGQQSSSSLPPVSSGVPFLSSARIIAAFGSQTANTVFAGPTSGGAAAPAFRALVVADIPGGAELSSTTTLAATQTITTSTTLVDVTGTSQNVLAGQRYRMQAIWFGSAVDITGGLKTALAATATFTSFTGNVTYNSTTAALSAQQQTTATATNTFAGSATIFVALDATFVVNAAGNVRMQVAQFAANGSSSLLLGSRMTLTPIL